MIGKRTEISTASEGDAGGFHDLLNLLGLAKEADFFVRSLKEQKNDMRYLLVAKHDGRIVGFAVLNSGPQYALFRRLEIPEIQDLNVAPAARRQGVATALIAHCERHAQMRGCLNVGIAVGLDSSYGAAQRLYVKLGYVPDGNGITYNREAVHKGEFRPVDDDLCLMMVKALPL